MSNWYDNYFQGVALDFWNSAVNPLAAQESKFLKQVLGARKGARLLDVPCGNGRHAVELAAMGCRVIGVDFSKEQIGIAKAAAKKRGVSVDWIVADKRTLKWEREFDGAICCGNSFGYLDDEGMEQFVAGVARALKPKARFVIDTAMAAESIIPNLDQSWWMETGSVTVMIANHYEADQSRLHTTLRFLKDGKEEVREIFHRVYTVAEIRKLLAGHGIHVTSLYADIDKKPYALGEPQLWVVGEKR